VLSKVRILAAPSATFLLPTQIPLSNPFLPQAAHCSGVSAGASTNTDRTSAGYQELATTPGRRFTEYGPRFTSWDTTTFQFMFGLRGNVFDGIKWDLSAQYGETNQNQSRLNWGSRSRVQQALRAVNRTTCSDTSNGCVPLNLFGPEGSITPEMIAFFDLDAFIRRNVRQTVILGTVGGDIAAIQSPLAVSPIAFSTPKFRAAAAP